MSDGGVPTTSEAANELPLRGTIRGPSARTHASAPASGAEYAATRPLVDVTCRALDVVVGALLVIAFAPLMVLIAIAIRLDTRGPLFFRQRRVGRHQELFTVVKFRTMRHDADHAVHRDYMLRLIQGNEPASKLPRDDRITRLGHLLRRTSLDELPQLWNVLCGSMSLVGPRPAIPYEVSNYPEHWFARFAVKPGVTGVWQISGRSQVSLEEMIRMDVAYVDQRCARLNLWILIRTVPAVLSTRGAG